MYVDVSVVHVCKLRVSLCCVCTSILSAYLVCCVCMQVRASLWCVRMCVCVCVCVHVLPCRLPLTRLSREPQLTQQNAERASQEEVTGSRPHTPRMGNPAATLHCPVGRGFPALTPPQPRASRLGEQGQGEQRHPQKGDPGVILSCPYLTGVLG